jgi:cytochrome P450
VRYDPFDPEFLRDPYPAYAWLREHSPVHHQPRSDEAPSFWALSRFDDIWDAVREPEIFSSANGLTFFPDEIGQLGLAPTIVMMDPPRQTQLRGLIGRGFTPKRVAELEDTIRAFARDRACDIRDGADDLHQDFSSTIPTFVLAELLGVPHADRVRFAPWVRALTDLQNDAFGSAAAAGVAVIAEMFEYFSAAISEQRRAPRDDLIGALVQAEVDGERLTDWDILGFCFVMVAGGSDTTASLISHGISLLSDAPSQRALLLSDPTLLPGALVEFLRLESSVQGLCRETTQDVTIRDTTIPAGQKVLMLYGAANRDPQEFGATADQVDIRREVGRHLAFSSGPHFCIGNHLARLQARVALEELLAAVPQITVDASAGTRQPSVFVRGWESLPVASTH